MAAMPEANATALPDSSPPTTSSSASQVGVPSSREYSRPLPMMKFDAGIGGTFSGAPGSEARPAEMSHDSGLIPDGCLSMVSHTSRQEDFYCGTAGSHAHGITARVARPHLLCAARWQSSTPLYTTVALIPTIKKAST